MNINTFDLNCGAFQNHSEKSEGGKAGNIALKCIYMYMEGAGDLVWAFFFHRDLLILPNIRDWLS